MTDQQVQAIVKRVEVIATNSNETERDALNFLDEMGYVETDTVIDMDLMDDVLNIEGDE